MNEILATIIVPAFNAAAWLPQCLESAVSQTEENIEIICVDNASTDESAQIIAEAARKDPRVRMLAENRPGVSFARNAGIRAAQGEYVFFLDADDFIEPDTVEKAVAKARKTEAQATIFSFDEYYGAEDVHILRERCPEERLYQGAFSLSDVEGISTELTTPNCVRMAYRRDWLLEHGFLFPTEIKTSEDLVFVNRVLFSADRLAILPDCLYHYRRDVQSATRKDRGSDGLIALELIKQEIDALSQQRPWIERHFVNLVADTLEYQLGSCACAEEFSRLHQGWADVWRPYVSERSRLLAPRYENFFRNTSGTELESLFSIYRANRDETERLRSDVSRLVRDVQTERQGREEAQRERDKIATSTSFKIGHAIVSPIAKMTGR